MSAGRSSSIKRHLWPLVLVGLAFAMSAAPALARSHTFFSLSLGIPLYAGPPAYYYGPYYAPAPVYYPPPPVIVVPTPAAAPGCRTGLWRQADGSVVNGIACQQADGTWRLSGY
jgi:hypothetical protein